MFVLISIGAIQCPASRASCIEIAIEPGALRFSCWNVAAREIVEDTPFKLPDATFSLVPALD